MGEAQRGRWLEGYTRLTPFEEVSFSRPSENREMEPGESYEVDDPPNHRVESPWPGGKQVATTQTMNQDRETVGNIEADHGCGAQRVERASAKG